MVGNRFKILIALAIMALQGCSFLGIGNSDFNCPGGIEGVRCMSARKVYEATEFSDYVQTKDEKKNPEIIVENNIKRSVNRIPVPRINQAIPIRSQAKVMRILVLPWQDEDGDLHADGFIYTEIESRKWNLGEKFTSPSFSVSPLN